MGCGLEIQPQGTHVAFAAGTGVLVFIDLVAHLILKLVDSNFSGALNESGEDEAEQLDLENFRFKLFASFSDEEEAIALDLINALKKLTEKLDKPDLF